MNNKDVRKANIWLKCQSALVYIVHSMNSSNYNKGARFYINYLDICPAFKVAFD